MLLSNALNVGRTQVFGMRCSQRCFVHSQSYSRVCDWQSEAELTKNLVKNVIYSDNAFVALSKPWGLPCYNVGGKDQNLTRRKREYLDSLDSSFGFVKSPIVLTDTFDYLASICQVPRLHIAKSCHRLWSGVTLLSSSEDAIGLVQKSVRRAKASSLPHLRFFCITSGVMNPPSGSEKCGIELFELDEFGDFKEPVYISPDQIVGERKQKARKSMTSNFKTANVRWQTLATNRDLGVSLIELQTSLTRWNFIQCFLAYKAAFVLGDQFFSRRVNHVMGVPFVQKLRKVQSVDNILAANRVPVQLLPHLKSALQIRSHNEVPLMIHLAGVTLPGLVRATKSFKCHKIKNPKQAVDENQLDHHQQQLQPFSNDMILAADMPAHLPDHFLLTLRRLKLNMFE